MANVLYYCTAVGIIYTNYIGRRVSTSDGFHWLIMVHTKCLYDCVVKSPNFNPVKIKIKPPSNVPQSVTIQTN